MYLASELCQAEAEIIYKSLKNGLEMTLTSALNFKIPANFAGRWDVDIFCDSPLKRKQRCSHKHLTLNEVTNISVHRQFAY